jgi:O-antigen ligase
LLAELLYRLLSKKRALPFGNVLLGSAIGVALLSLFAERMRNGVAVFALMLLLAGLLWLLGQKQRLKKTGLVIGALTLVVVTFGGLGLAVAIKGHTDLEKLIETAPIAWDTEHHQGWLNEKKYGLPLLSTGEAVDPSAYQRIAWLKQGLLMIGEHPFGIGFGRNAYGHGLKAKYGEGAGHSHSGLLDLAIGTGIPGTLLWLGFFVSLMRLAWKHARAAHGYAATLLLFVLLDFGLRMVVDSVIRDHMLQQFLFLAGFAAALTVAEVPKKRKSSA